MQDRELYRQILGIEAPRFVERVELKVAEGEVHIYLEHQENAEKGASCMTIKRSAMGASGHLPISNHSARSAAAERVASLGYGW